ncbi:MAG: hypothetical protein WC379_15310 [Methanoregula sp.]|jgi:hypothetical protein
MDIWITREWLGAILIIIGGIVLTIWNLGTKIDLAILSTTILNPVFITGIIFLLAGIFVLRSKLFHRVSF